MKQPTLRIETSLLDSILVRVAQPSLGFVPGFPGRHMSTDKFIFIIFHSRSS